MRQVNFLTTVFAISSMLLSFNSCNSGDEKKETDVTQNADSSTAPQKEPVSKSANLMFIKHKVANFAKWLPLYDAHDSVRKAYGLHNYGLSRGVDDTNMVMVVLRIDDMNRAKEFASLPDLKATMQKAGVVGEPTITYFNRQTLFLSTNDPSTRVMVSHKVKDWEAWKKEYDNHKQARVDAGLTDRSVGYEVDNNNNVIIVEVVGDLKKARDFFASKGLKDRMQAAGVEGAPSIFFYNLLKSY